MNCRNETEQDFRAARSVALAASISSLIMLTPTTADLRTAIEVLKMLDRRITEQATHSASQLPKTVLGDQYAEHIKAQTQEQASHIEKVSEQLKSWREQLLQDNKRQVFQKV